MRSKTTITIETVKRVRIVNSPNGQANTCPLCGAETNHDQQIARSCEADHHDIVRQLTDATDIERLRSGKLTDE